METIRTYEVQIKGANSVKELKQEIADLRDKLVKLDSTSEEYKSTVNDIVTSETKLKQVMSAGKSQSEALEGSYNALVNQMSALKKVWREVTDEATRADLGRQIKDINDQLKAMDASTGNFQRNVGGYEQAMESAFGETARAKVARLKQELANIEEGTDAYRSKWQELSDAMIEAKKQQENLAYSTSDIGGILGNTATALGSLAGGFAVAQGTMTLFGAESKEVGEQMLKLQSVIAIIKGLEQLESLRDKLPALAKGIKTWAASLFQSSAASSAAAAATTGLSTAQGGNLATTTELTAATARATAENMMFVGSLLDRQEAGQALTATEAAILESYREQERALIEYTAQQELAIGQTQTYRTALMELVEARRLETGAVEAEYVAQKQGEAGLMQAIGSKEVTKAQREQFDAQKQLNAEVGKSKSIFTTSGAAAKKLSFELKAAGASSKVAAAGFKLAAVGCGILRSAWMMLEGVIAASVIGGIIMAVYWAFEKLIEIGKDFFAESTELGEGIKNLAFENERLLESVERTNDSMDYEARLMEAQGKSYEDVYQYKKKIIAANLAELASQLNNNQAKYAGLTAAQKEGEEGKKLKETIDQLTEAYDREYAAKQKLIQDNEVHKAQEATREAQEAARKAQQAADERKRKADEEKKKMQQELDNLKKEIDDYGKDSIDKLEEERSKKLTILERMGKDTEDYKKKEKELNDHYDKLIQDEKDKTNKKIWEAQRKANQRYLETFDTKTEAGAMGRLQEEQKQAEKMFVDLQDAHVAGDESALKKLNALYGLSMESLDDLAVETQIAFKKMNDAADNTREHIAEGLVKGVDDAVEAIATDTEIQIRRVQNAYGILDSQKKNGLSTKQKQEEEDRLYEIEKQNILKQKVLYQALADDETLSNEQRLEARRKFIDASMALEDLDAQHTIETNKLKQESYEKTTENIGKAMNGISDILGNAANAYQTYIENQIKGGEMSEEEGERQFENVKKIQQAQALINAFLSANEAYSSLAGIPIVGPALGAAAAAAALASGLMQVKAIEYTSLNSSSSSSSTSTNGLTINTAVNPTPIDYSPQGIVNLTGLQENQDLANSLGNGGIKAYVVESEVSAKQELSRRRESETTF